MIYFILMMLTGTLVGGASLHAMPLEAEKSALVSGIMRLNAASQIRIRIPYQPWNMTDEEYILLLVEQVQDFHHHLRNLIQLVQRRDEGLPIVPINRQPTLLITLQDIERILATQRDTSNRIEEIE